MSSDYLFVYGTLRKAAENPVRESMLAYARFVAEATVMGQLYRVSHYPALVLQEPAYQVKGELYQVMAAAQLWPILDHYEGLCVDASEPHEYRKAQVMVTCSDGRQCMATAYLYNRDIADLELIASGDFLAQCDNAGP